MSTVARRPFPLAALLVALLGLCSACVSGPAAVPRALAGPNLFSGAVNGGCYLETASTCAIHIDAWQPIVADPGTTLDGWRLIALQNGSARLLSDFGTDVSNPPSGSYLPSLVRKGYLAECGATYALVISAKDSGDLSFEDIGQTNSFLCPAGATATPTATPEASPTATPTSTPTGTPSPGWWLPLPFIIGSP